MHRIPCGRWVAVLAIVVLAATLFFAVYRFSAPAHSGYFYEPASTDAERATFLEQFGCQINKEPIETVVLTIPEPLDRVYQNYETILAEDGLSLVPYQGKTVTRYTYSVTNYPGVPEAHANLLVFGDRVIGGDISTVALDGFMHSFSEFKKVIKKT